MDPIQLVNQAMMMMRKGDLRAATDIAHRLMASHPALAPVQYLNAEIALATGQPEAALSHIEKALALEPDQPALHLKRARIEIALRQGVKARKTAHATADRWPDDVGVQYEAASIHTLCDDHDGAAVFLAKAVALGAKGPAFLFDQARNQFYRGDIDDAEATIEAFLSEVPGNGEAILFRARLKGQTDKANHIADIEALLGRDMPWGQRVRLFYALAKEKEDIGDHKGAFEALSAGADLQRQHLRYDGDTERQNMADICATFTPDAFARIPEGAASDSPIFIIGLPRTGTTLVERIIGGHPDVVSVGETNDFTLAMGGVINRYIASHPGEDLTPLKAAPHVDYDEMGRIYCASVAGMVGKADHVIDKMPINFLYCGLIRKALPNARLVHLVRDPMDTCFAIYKTLFNQAYYFSYDLADLADYYIAYRKMMDHWHALMPGAILDVRYEDLVANPKAEGKRILEHCGLTWSDDLANIEAAAAPSSTASAAQIRQPIYTSSVNLWENYRDQLSGLEATLASAGYLKS